MPHGRRVALYHAECRREQQRVREGWARNSGRLRQSVDSSSLDTFLAVMDVASRVAMAAAAGVAAAAIWRAYCRRKIETPAVDCTEPPVAAQCRPLNEPDTEKHWTEKHWLLHLTRIIFTAKVRCPAL